MVTTRSQQAVLNHAAEEAINKAGDRGIKQMLGVKPVRRQAKKARTTINSGELARLRQDLERAKRAKNSVLAGRSTWANRQTKRATPSNKNIRTGVGALFEPKMAGYHWNQFGPVWPSQFFASEIARKNRGAQPQPLSLARPQHFAVYEKLGECRSRLQQYERMFGKQNFGGQYNNGKPRAKPATH